MRKILSSLICLLCFTSVFAYEGMLAGQKDLKVIKTEFFVDVSCMLIGKVVGEFLCSLGNKLV